jgi:2-polyprenyl-3-methyl-5-hydroxy-6-metoxy-1,4-benzoquinol methylase
MEFIQKNILSFISFDSKIDYFVFGLATFCVLVVFAFLFFKFCLKKKFSYHSQEYWESRYSLYTREMDWYGNFQKICKDFNLDKILEEGLPKKKNRAKVIELGCGNSTLAHDLVEFGFKNVTSIDFSSTVIDKMKKKYAKDNIKCKDFFNKS